MMVCPEEGCSKTFKKASKMKVHQMLHTGERPYKCTWLDCLWAFTTSHKLKRHLESHEGRKDYECDYPGCGHKLSTIYNLNTHRKLHLRPLTEDCPQKDCDRKFHTKRQLEIHLKNDHGVEEKTFKCPKPGCDKVFYSSSCMGSHMRFHNQNTDTYKCKFEGCDKTFTKLCRLRQHEKLHSGEKPYICNYQDCKWAFPTASKLKRHQTKHTGLRKWQCDICYKFFMRSEHLKGHLITHSEEKPFECPVEGCGNKFRAKSSLYVHLRKHDESGKTIVYHCPLDRCDRYYSCKASLRQHLLTKHCTNPDLTADNTQQPERVVNWLSVLHTAGQGHDPNIINGQELSPNEGMVETDSLTNHPEYISSQFLANDLPDQNLLTSSSTSILITNSKNINTSAKLVVPQMVVVPHTPSLTSFHTSSSPLNTATPTITSLRTPSTSLPSISKGIVVAATTLASSNNHLTLEEIQQQLRQRQLQLEQEQLQHQQQQLRQSNKKDQLLQQQSSHQVMDSRGIVQPDKIPEETLEKGKKKQMVFESMHGSARTDARSNEIISLRAFNRWQKQKEMEAAKLRIHLDTQSTSSSSSSSSSSSLLSSSPALVSIPHATSHIPLVSRVELDTSQIISQNGAMVFKTEIPDLELQAEGIQTTVLDGCSTTGGHSDTFMTDLFMKDPETGLTYRQTQLLQDDPPTLCLLEEMGEVEPSHNVVLDAELEGNLIDESLPFQELE